MGRVRPLFIIGFVLMVLNCLACIFDPTLLPDVIAYGGIVGLIGAFLIAIVGLVLVLIDLKLRKRKPKDQTNSGKRIKKKIKPRTIALIVIAVFVFFGYSSTITDLKNERETNRELTKEIDFWRTYAVIVPKGDKKYHTYGCKETEGKSFWIYNVDAAIWNGYEPCSVCNPTGR